MSDMPYYETVAGLHRDAAQMEQVYQEAVRAGESDAFKDAVDRSYAAAPENLLYAAWFYRLKHAAARAKGHAVAWGWAIPLALANGLLFWWLSDQRFMVTIETFRGNARDFLPVIAFLGAALSALSILAFMAAAGRRRWLPGVIIPVLLLAASAYVLLTYPETGTLPFQEQYLTLMVLHLALLAWAGVGAFLLARHRDPENRFAFLIKSLEVFILAGLFVIAGGLFTGITVGLFDALNVDFPEWAQRLFIAGGGGLIPVVATAVIYNPAAPPAGQSFDEGLSKLVALLMRILLPLTLLVLLVYLAFIPFNFRAPFENRDVLIIYNGMLFAVVALLVGATPVSLSDIAPRLRRWLRLGIIAVAVLALVISLYALAAILYRTSLDRLTPNRLAFIGWNLINIGVLALVLFFQLRARREQWAHRLHRAYSAGTIAYVVWTVALILAIPWLFGIDQGDIGSLPRTVQLIVYEHPAPILLKCTNSPHIYLLEKGEKRWIEDIETFNERGYVWRDVQSISCDHLRRVPDGVPIPADAGPAPQP